MEASGRPPTLIFVAALAACGSGDAPAPSSGTRLGPALIASFQAAERALAPWRCAAEDAPGLGDATLRVGSRQWKLAGHTISTRGDAPLTIGFVADAAGAAPATLAALGRLHAALADADLVITLGGMGRTAAELEATLGVLAGNALLIALPGDLEDAAEQTAAVAKLTATGKHVVDGRLVRELELPGATIATLAGASAQSRLVASAEGCAYSVDDIATAYARLTPRTGLRILASAEAPRVFVGGEPAGEHALELGAGQEIDIAVHGPVAATATPARTGKRDGSATPLSPGSSDAAPRLPNARPVPTAGLLTITPGAWRWRPLEGTR